MTFPIYGKIIQNAPNHQPDKYFSDPAARLGVFRTSISELVGFSSGNGRACERFHETMVAKTLNPGTTGCIVDIVIKHETLTRNTDWILI